MSIHSINSLYLYSDQIVEIAFSLLPSKIVRKYKSLIILRMYRSVLIMKWHILILQIVDVNEGRYNTFSIPSRFQKKKLVLISDIIAKIGFNCNLVVQTSVLVSKLWLYHTFSKIWFRLCVYIYGVLRYLSSIAILTTTGDHTTYLVLVHRPIP